MKLPALVLTTALFLSLLLTGTASASSSYIGQSAKSVASKIHCKHFHKVAGSGPGAYNLDSAVCRLKGRRVNIITFRSAHQKATWSELAAAVFGANFYWASGKGAIVVARNGNHAAAVIGSHRLPGKVRHG